MNCSLLSGRNIRLLVLAIAVGSAAHVQAAETTPNPDAHFRATFDGSAAAVLGSATLNPGDAQTATFIKSEHSQALAVRAGTNLRYKLGEMFPGESGSLEIRFRPDFPQAPDQPARTLFTLAGPDGAKLTLSFEPQGTRWCFNVEFPKWRRELAAYYFDKEPAGKWQHFVLTWEDRAGAAPALQLYRNGKWDRSRTETYKHRLDGFHELVIGGDEAEASIDEIVIYKRALQQEEVAYLYRDTSEERLAGLARETAEIERRTAREQGARRELLAELDGKVAQLINPRGGAQRDFKLPGGITAKGLRVDDVGQVDLTRFAVIYGPPGGAYQLNARQTEQIRQYVANGGGYVGVCAGANYAGKAKLLNMTTHSLRNQGLVTVGITRHPITDGYGTDVVIHHGNGPIMIPGEGCQVIGRFSIGQNFPITTAAIVAGQNGKGRVAAFGPHPTGGGVKFQNNGTKFSGEELGSDRLLINALLWAAKITDAP